MELLITLTAALICSGLFIGLMELPIFGAQKEER